MERIKIKAKVISIKKSEVRKGIYYVTGLSDSFNEVKWVSKKAYEVGSEVLLQSQRNRIQTDKIRWEVVKNEKNLWL